MLLCRQSTAYNLGCHTFLENFAAWHTYTKGKQCCECLKKKLVESWGYNYTELLIHSVPVRVGLGCSVALKLFSLELLRLKALLRLKPPLPLLDFFTCCGLPDEVGLSCG